MIIITFIQNISSFVMAAFDIWVQHLSSQPAIDWD